MYHISHIANNMISMKDSQFDDFIDATAPIWRFGGRHSPNEASFLKFNLLDRNTSWNISINMEIFLHKWTQICSQWSWATQESFLNGPNESKSLTIFDSVESLWLTGGGVRDFESFPLTLKCSIKFLKASKEFTRSLDRGLLDDNDVWLERNHKNFMHELFSSHTND